MADEEGQQSGRPPQQTESGKLAEGGAGFFDRLRTVPIWAKIALMSVIVFLASIGYLRSLSHHAEDGLESQERHSSLPAPGERKAAPDILLVAGAGASHNLSSLKGKVVLLSFWASWCTPCLLELPTFIDLYERLHEKGLEIVPVNVEDVQEAATVVESFWKTKKFPFPTFYDPSHKSTEAFAVDPLPSNFIIDKQGRIAAQAFGANDWTSEVSLKLLEDLLAE
jgi:thiol-disulfide isomerase/thioredoxin